MSDYALKTLDPQFYEMDGEKYGMTFRCPNCRARGGVFFENSIPSGKNLRPATGATWKREGDTFETMTLNPSVRMFNHFHSWIKGGMLCVDSPFECTAPA